MHKNLKACIVPASSRREPPTRPLIGVLDGEGVGSQVVGIACRVLEAATSATGRELEFRLAAEHGITTESVKREPLAPEIVRFCEGLFADGGALLAGPCGGRFVYDLRKRFDLFCKLVPVRPFPELAGVGPVRDEHKRDLDLVLIRENASGVYFGTHTVTECDEHGRRIDYRFSYSQREVERVLEVGARIAAGRRNGLTVVTKEGGLPGLGELWRGCAGDVGRRSGVNVRVINVDYAAYLLIQEPHELDVVVTPNLFGDVLADLSAVLLGSRGLSFSANYSATGAAVYQTNHGAAYDLTGRDRANPAAQILSAAMMLRECFGLDAEAALIERALAHVWSRGIRTDDLGGDPARTVGTDEMGRLVADAVLGTPAPGPGA